MVTLQFSCSDREQTTEHNNNRIIFLWYRLQKGISLAIFRNILAMLYWEKYILSLARQMQTLLVRGHRIRMAETVETVNTFKELGTWQIPPYTCDHADEQARTDLLHPRIRRRTTTYIMHNNNNNNNYVNGGKRNSLMISWLHDLSIRHRYQGWEGAVGKARR